MDIQLFLILLAFVSAAALYMKYGRGVGQELVVAVLIDSWLDRALWLRV